MGCIISFPTMPSNFAERQVEKIDPLLQWVESQFGFKPIVYSSFFGGKQEDGLVNAIENLLKKTDDCELAAIDAIASAAHSLTIAIGIFRGKLQIEEAIELIRLEEDLQVSFFFLFPSYSLSLSYPGLAHMHTRLLHGVTYSSNSNSLNLFLQGIVLY